MKTDFEQIIHSPVAAYQEGLHRLKDLADVQELVKVKNLTADYAEKLNPFVRVKFLELQKAVEDS